MHEGQLCTVGWSKLHSVGAKIISLSSPRSRQQRAIKRNKRIDTLLEKLFKTYFFMKLYFTTVFEMQNRKEFSWFNVHEVHECFQQTLHKCI